MAAVKSQEEQFSWLDNSFVSTDVKSVDMSHSAKRSHGSGLQNGKRKTTKLQCVTQKNGVNDVSIYSLPQFTAKSDDKTSSSVERGNKKAKAIEQPCQQSDSCISLADDDEVCSLSKQDQLTTSLVLSIVILLLLHTFCSGSKQLL